MQTDELKILNFAFVPLSDEAGSDDDMGSDAADLDDDEDEEEEGMEVMGDDDDDEVGME